MGPLTILIAASLLVAYLMVERDERLSDKP